MNGLVDIVRISPLGLETLDIVKQFKANELGKAPLKTTNSRDCNGYWNGIAGLELT